MSRVLDWSHPNLDHSVIQQPTGFQQAGIQALDPLRPGHEAPAGFVSSHSVNVVLSSSLAAFISLLQGSFMLQTMHRLPMQRQGSCCPLLLFALQM